MKKNCLTCLVHDTKPFKDKELFLISEAVETYLDLMDDTIAEYVNESAPKETLKAIKELHTILRKIQKYRRNE